MINKIIKEIKEYVEEIKDQVVGTIEEIKRVWGEYDLREYNLIGKPIVAFFITLANLLYTFVMGIGIIAVVVLAFILPFLLPIAWLIHWILETLIKLLKKRA